MSNGPLKRKRAGGAVQGECGELDKVGWTMGKRRNRAWGGGGEENFMKHALNQFMILYVL
ncbi:hypothetical protein EON63_10575 [archaeon]|nr:MAG: hypothetical protein EON63_10575 [archaeon]